jgi:tRNA (cytidine/uridine-2'-O-)-methyltransferase
VAEPVFHLALLHPEIPGNTGNIGRLSLGLGARLHLIHPLGFDPSDKAARRAGLDHWVSVDVQEHESAEAFWAWSEGRRVHLFSAAGSRAYTQVPWQRGDVLVFGRESMGLPRALVAERGAWRVPTPGPVRSLNLSNAVAVVAYRALEHLEPGLFGS